MTPYRTIEFTGTAVRLLDQRVLPHVTRYVDFSSYEDVSNAIRDMVVRGAPAIGATAAYALALAVHDARGSAAQARTRLAQAAAVLRTSRPTAVNLFWAIERILKRAEDLMLHTAADVARAVREEADALAEEDVRSCRQMGAHALPLVPQNARIFHHCNTGALATVDYGTALGLIRAAHEAGRNVFVYVDETRPRLQGARLTSWELKQLGIKHAVVVDGASGHIMRTRGADLCVVGCDRVAANGDTANKIGTYNLALAARAHGIPFYVAAPLSTIDLNLPSGDRIPIEERHPAEVSMLNGELITPEGAEVYNPAFDVTPAAYITAFITGAGLAYPPYGKSLPALVMAAQGRAV